MRKNKGGIMSEKILFVDDEPGVLEGYRRLLHKEFSIDTAASGREGLAAIVAAQPDAYGVIVSDMRMPEMDGVQFLSRVRSISGDSVRIALTGYADIQTASNAVNEGAIFRFLTKPCEKEVLAKALTEGLVQHRLMVAEKELLEKTLRGSVKVLTEVLSLVNPAAFSRGVRVGKYVRHIVKELQLNTPWQFEVAGMMSQLGCVTLDTETIEAVYAGKRLSADEQARYDTHAGVAAELLSNIPRLEAVAHMIAKQDSAPPYSPAGIDLKQDPVALGAQILRVAIAYDQLLSSGSGHEESLKQLLSRTKEFARMVVDALANLELETQRMEVKRCLISELECDMVLQEDVRTTTEMLLVAKGTQISYALLARMRNFLRRDPISGTVLVHVPHKASAGPAVLPKANEAAAGASSGKP
jgi:response regulator RpfG family c-di-GMP phosphodiesterase